MSSTGNALRTVCRSCRRGLRESNPLIRPFSSTANRYKNVPTFNETNNPELDTLFQTFREQVFIPDSLSQDHRRLLYRPSRQAVLLNEPGVTVSLSDEEEVQLKPMRFDERPNKRKSFRKIESILGATADDEAWNNLLPFFEGIKLSEWKMDANFEEHITKRAYDQGKIGTIVKLVEMSKRTNISLSNPYLTKELMLACHRNAVTAGLQGEEFDRSFRTVRNLASLLEKQEHCGGKIKEGQVDMRKSLTVLGVLLEMYAAEAINNGGIDKDGNVAGFLSKTLALSEQSLCDDWVFQNPQGGEKLSELAIQGRQLECMLPLLHGMQLAAKVQGVPPGSMKKPYDDRLRALQSEVGNRLRQTKSGLESIQKKLKDQGKTLRSNSMRALDMQTELDAVQI